MGAGGPYTITDYNGITAAEQQSAFRDYVSRNKYLSDHKGGYAERYREVKSWKHRFDAKLLQDIFHDFGTDRKYILQFRVDFLNIGNLPNDSWGTYTSNPLAGYDYVRPLRVNSRGSSSAAPVFTLYASSLEDFAKKTALSKDVSTSSTWGCLIGLYLIF